MAQTRIRKAIEVVLTFVLCVAVTACLDTGYDQVEKAEEASQGETTTKAIHEESYSEEQRAAEVSLSFSEGVFWESLSDEAKNAISTYFLYRGKQLTAIPSDSETIESSGIRIGEKLKVLCHRRDEAAALFKESLQTGNSFVLESCDIESVFSEGETTYVRLKETIRFEHQQADSKTIKMSWSQQHSLVLFSETQIEMDYYSEELPGQTPFMETSDHATATADVRAYQEAHPVSDDLIRQQMDALRSDHPQMTIEEAEWASEYEIAHSSEIEEEALLFFLENPSSCYYLPLEQYHAILVLKRTLVCRHPETGEKKYPLGPGDDIVFFIRNGEIVDQVRIGDFELPPGY